MPDKLTLFYAVTPDLPYPRFAAQSIYSALRANPGIRIHLIEVPMDEYAEAAHVQGLPVEPDGRRDEWCAILDADCWVNGSLAPLLDHPEPINLRVANAWRKGQINHDEWWAICDRFRLSQVPVFSNGLILCRRYVATVLRAELLPWMERIRSCGLPDPMHIKKRSEWWMRDQYALAAICATHAWPVGRLSAKDISWNFNGETGGIVHHVGKDFNPFTEAEWPQYMITGQRS